MYVINEVLTNVQTCVDLKIVNLQRVSNLIARLKSAEASAMLTKGFHSKKGSTAASDALMHGGSYWEGTADLPHEPSVGDIIDED